MEEDGESSTESQPQTLRYRHANRQPIRQVVHPISNDDDPGQRLYRGHRGQPVTLQRKNKPLIRAWMRGWIGLEYKVEHSSPCGK